jgi:ribose-phosphate pyrophosphokinase
MPALRRFREFTIESVMNQLPPPLLFTLSESQALAAAIARHARMALAPLEERPFEEGEFKLRPLASVRDRTVFVVQSLAGSAGASVHQRLVRLLFLLFGLRDAGAARTIALLPHLSFARKESRTQARDPVNTRYVAQLLEATGLGRLVALDVHNPASLDNAFRIPVDHLSAIPMFVDHFAGTAPTAELAVMSPDIGGVKRVQIFHELLERRLGRTVELAFVEKRRAGGKVSSGRLVGEVADREVIVLDDLCASGGTLIRAAEIARAAGARAVHVAFAHATLERGLDALASAAAIARIVLTDSAAPSGHAQSLAGQGKLQLLSIAPLFGEVVARLSSGAALAPLLNSWPPADG